MIEIIAALLLGTLVGSSVTYYIVQKSQQKNIIREYESRIRDLNEKHQVALKESRNRSIDGSRAVIKGKIAEQLAPVLPNFRYLPSDARFIGDPIDYIIFNGYTNVKDNGASENDLEIVILDVKTGHSSLSQTQQAIAKAVNAGRVRFEVYRHEDVHSPSPLYSAVKNNLSSRKLTKNPIIQDARKTHPRAYEPWSRSEDQLLKHRYQQGATINELAIEFCRKPGGIRSRLKRLGIL